MTSKAETQGSSIDIVKLGVALLVVAASVYAFYYFAEQPLLYRVLGMLAGVVIAALVAARTQRGRDILSFVGEARTEVRKVVWPTREETVRGTLIVMAMVVFVALFLWLLDSLLGWLVRLITGQGG